LQIDVTARSPTYGGSGSIDLLGEFLVEGLAPVGGAVDRIEVDFLLTASPRAPRGDDVDVQALLDALGEAAGEEVGTGPDHADWGRSHEAERQKGPSLVFRRSARRVDVRLVSSLSELDVFGREPHPETFGRAARELVAGLDPLQQRAKTSDELDLPALTAHLNARIALLPEIEDELLSALETLSAARTERWAAMSPWDRLDVDWSLFAPEARTILDHPFYWDPADDDAPHGDDTGADLLADFLEQRPEDPLVFMEQQARDRGYESLSHLGQHEAEERDALLVATAFAQLKLTAQISLPLGELALEALVRRGGGEPTPADDLLMAPLVKARSLLLGHE
jgi:hypothetical protein